MKKKNVNLGKLNLSKSNIASFNQSQEIVGGILGPINTHKCPPHRRPPIETNFPACQATDVACGSAYNPTRCDCF